MPTLPSPVHSILRRGVRTGSRLTSGARMTPSFLVVGGQRCGTTSLWRALVQHPGLIGPARHKGVHFFDVHYDDGMSWYRGHFPLQRQARRIARETGTAPITGEATPYYMFHPLAPERIARDLPDARLLVLIRDPVERAYSAYTHEARRGHEAESFERALELEPARLSGEVERMRADPRYYSHVHRHNAYLARGRYIDQILAMEALVGRDRIHVVDSHQFFEEPAAVFPDVLDFLGLPPLPDAEFTQENARPRAPMAEPLRAELMGHFDSYDERLATWWGRTPRWRK